MSFLTIILEKTSLVSGDNSRHFRCTFLQLVKRFMFFRRLFGTLCTISISGLDSRSFSNFSKIVFAVAPGKSFNYIVCCFESPLSWILFNIESPATMIFRLTWILLDCCFENLMVGFLWFDIVAAFELEASFSLSPI